MPFASMSKVTSICGSPRRAGAIPSSLKFPNNLLSANILRSPWQIWMSTAGWLSAAVEKICDFFAGMVVFRSIMPVAIPPMVSMERVSGLTSRSSTSLTSPRRTPPWIAAPMATTSSGLTPWCGVCPASSRAISTTFGIRVIPPTRTSSSISFGVRPASLRQSRTGFLVRSKSESVSCSSLARVRVSWMCFGPVASAVTKGRLMSYDWVEDSAIFAFSASSLIRCRASG